MSSIRAPVSTDHARSSGIIYKPRRSTDDPSIFGSDQYKGMSYKAKAHRYYRSTLFQAILIGVLSFTQPGIWSAIAGLGAGGLQTVKTANTASSILFGIMFVFSPIFGILTNRIGIKPVITIGTVGFVFWSAGLYKNSLDGSQALILAGATLCGISASAFWTAEATVAILYPEEDSRGLFIGIWQCINKVGGVIAGGITLALNVNDSHEGKVGLNTYIVLMVIQCLGFPLSFLLSPPEKVIRKDGKTIKSNVLKRPLKEELNTFWRVLKRKEIICLAPLALSVVWFNTWQSNYITNHFSVRVRALNSLLTALIPGLTDVVFGTLLDLKYFKRSTRVKASWLTALIIMTAFFVYSLIIQNYFDKHPQTGIDWTGYPDFAKAFIPFQVFRIGGEMLFNWLYWVIGAYQFTSDEVSHCSAIIRSLESLGQTFAFVIGTVNQNDMTNLAVAVGAFYLSAISTTYIVFTANEDEITGRVEDFRLEDSTEEVEIVENSFIQKDLES